MNVYDKLLEKAKVDAEKAFARVERIERMKSRARKTYGISKRYLRIRDNQNCLRDDPVYVMVRGVLYGLDPYSSVGRGVAYSSYERRKEVQELWRRATVLRHEMWIRTMKESTYNALSDGTHPIYEQAKALGIKIRPGQKPQEILGTNDAVR